MSRQEWMLKPTNKELEFDVVENKKKKKERKNNQDEEIHANEITASTATTSSNTRVNDGGSSWQKKRIQRTIEYARESGKSLQEVAIERFGSFEEFLKLRNNDTEPPKKEAKRQEFKNESNFSIRDELDAPLEEKNPKKKRLNPLEEYQKSQLVQEKCWFCIDSNYFEQEFLVSRGTRTFLTVPKYSALSPLHCLIVPIPHCCSLLQADEDVWDEVRNYKKCLIRMCADVGKSVLFLETAMELKKQGHTFIEAIPFDAELLGTVKGFYKKAIMESESEWSQHKKIIDTEQKGGLRRSIPKEFPYFYVDFQLDKGFAHVIEEEDSFPRDFGKKIIANAMGIDDTEYRKNSLVDSAMTVEKRFAIFKKYYQSFDWTGMIE